MGWFKVYLESKMGGTCKIGKEKELRMTKVAGLRIQMDSGVIYEDNNQICS